jgi:hypothetical protein
VGGAQAIVKSDETRLELPRQTGMFVVLSNPADRQAFSANSTPDVPAHDPMFVVRKAP